MARLTGTILSLGIRMSSVSGAMGSYPFSPSDPVRQNLVRTALNELLLLKLGDVSALLDVRTRPEDVVVELRRLCERTLSSSCAATFLRSLLRTLGLTELDTLAGLTEIAGTVLVLMGEGFPIGL